MKDHCSEGAISKKTKVRHRSASLRELLPRLTDLFHDACTRASRSQRASIGVAIAATATFLGVAVAALPETPFNPDEDPSRIRWSRIEALFGRAPDVRGQRFGVILKTMTNEYWRLMAAGYRQLAAEDGVKLDIQAARGETDQVHQLLFMQNMIGSRYKALCISPISAVNLQPAIDEADAIGLPVVDVDGAVVDSVRHFVGPVNVEMGVRVAKWFEAHRPLGGKVAVIEGQAGVFSTVQRTRGFRDSILASGKFEIVASRSANWDRQQAFDTAKAIIAETPGIIGIYCNNDTMALGAVDAVKSANLLGQISVFGSDGTAAAFTSVTAGELAGTVNIFPTVIGRLGLNVAERLSEGQPIPRVVETPQVLITRDNIARYSVDADTIFKALLHDEER